MLPIILAFILGAALAGFVAWQFSARRAQKQATRQRQLLERTRRAEKMAELGQLTGHLAHEIRNPLSTIKLNLQLLAEDVSDMIRRHDRQSYDGSPEDQIQKLHRQKRKLETVVKEADRLTTTLNEFLVYAGKMELHRIDQDINELVDDLTDFYEPQANGRGVKMLCSLGSGPLTSRVDGGMIKQALLNLMINAVQHMDGGGELMVCTRMQDNDVVIEVTDTGPGIAPELQEKIFDVYYTTRPGGSGLGLPMCRRIVEEHDGHITLHSEPGKGSRFTITLPLAYTQQQKQQAVQADTVEPN